jgi:hypothetical protein
LQLLTTWLSGVLAVQQHLLFYSRLALASQLLLLLLLLMLPFLALLLDLML